MNYFQGLFGGDATEYFEEKEAEAAAAYSLETYGEGDYTNDGISERYAAISRRDFLDKQSRLEPLEDMLYDGVLDPEKKAARAQEAQSLVSSSITGAYDQADRRSSVMRSRLNRKYSAADQATDARNRSQNESADLVHGRNSTKEYLRDEEISVLADY